VVVVSSSPSGELPGLRRFEEEPPADELPATTAATLEALDERCVDWRPPTPPPEDPAPPLDFIGDLVLLLLALEEDDWFLVRTIDIDSALSARPALLPAALLARTPQKLHGEVIL